MQLWKNGKMIGDKRKPHDLALLKKKGLLISEGKGRATVWKKS